MISYHFNGERASPVFNISDQNYAVANFDIEIGPIFYRTEISDPTIKPCYVILLRSW
jgi:hypothetical protein